MKRPHGFAAAVLPTAVALLAITALDPAAAQVASRDGDVVVKGRKETSRKRADRFVRQIIATDVGQLARYADPVCPQILGVPPSLADAIGDRLRRLAIGAGVRVAPPGCAPNLLAIVAANADGFIKTMRRRHGSFFDDLSDVDLRDAFRSGAVHSWRLIENRDEDGIPVSGDPPVAETSTSSVFSLPTQATTVNAVVVFDKQVVLDKTVAQMADYIAMRTLAGARPPRNGVAAEETILSLFDAGSGPPRQASPVDRRLLAGLYGVDPMSNGMAQASRIARGIAAGDGPATAPK